MITKLASLSGVEKLPKLGVVLGLLGQGECRGGGNYAAAGI